MRHLVLLGDSIFDNGAYVPDGPSLIEHVRRLLAVGDRASLIARDQATIAAVYPQLEELPVDATHLVLSVGGNNALWAAGNVLHERTSNIRDALQKFSKVVFEFKQEYLELIDELMSREIHLTTCTIYDTVPDLDSAEHMGLGMFNDVITRTAFRRGLSLIDLRNICNERSDYSEISPIEPSASGGGKIARAIMAATTEGKMYNRVYS